MSQQQIPEHKPLGNFRSHHPDGCGDPPSSILLQQALDGDNEAFARVVVKYTPFVRERVLAEMRRKGVSHDSEFCDRVVHEVWVEFYKKRETLHRNQRTGRLTPPVMAWLLTVIRLKVLEQLRERGRSSDPSDIDVPDEGGHPCVRVILQSEFMQDFTRAIGALSDIQRQVFLLRVSEELSSADVAAKLGLTSDKVAQHLIKAKKHLQQYLDVTWLKDLSEPD